LESVSVLATSCSVKNIRRFRGLLTSWAQSLFFLGSTISGSEGLLRKSTEDSFSLFPPHPTHDNLTFSGSLCGEGLAWRSDFQKKKKLKTFPIRSLGQLMAGQFKFCRYATGEGRSSLRIKSDHRLVYWSLACIIYDDTHLTFPKWIINSY